jgi:hypothetical protein
VIFSSFKNVCNFNLAYLKKLGNYLKELIILKTELLNNFCDALLLEILTINPNAYPMLKNPFCHNEFGDH